MSATGRGAVRNENDFYPTPEYCIQDALAAWIKADSISNFASWHILDPCCGLRPYAKVLAALGFDKVWNVDIRPEAEADNTADFLTYKCSFVPHLIVSNPPFNLAKQFIIKALEDVWENGYVIFLLRLNFLGSQKRLSF